MHMTLAHIFGGLGFLVILAVIVKGFWSGDRTKSTEQPDNWQNGSGSGND